MTKIGYKQSAEHKRKRLSQIEGDRNGSWAGGHHPDYYRKKAGAKTNDGTVVHHKNGDRENNKKSNLERLTDGDRVPGRRTTPKHEQITDRTSRKDGMKGKRCPGGYWIPQSKKCALGQAGHFTHRTAEGGRKSAIENIVWPATALAIAGAGVAGLGIAGYAIASSGDKPSGNAEKKKLIGAIVKAEEKKDPEVTIAPSIEKPTAPTIPPVPKSDRPKKGLIRDVRQFKREQGVKEIDRRLQKERRRPENPRILGKRKIVEKLVETEKQKTKGGVMVHVPASGKTHTFTPQPAIQAAVAKAKAIEKGSLANPPGRPPNVWADFKRKNPKGAYRKKKKSDSTIAIRLAMKQAV